MVPTTEYETRTVQVTKYRPEARQSNYTVSRQVPVTQQVQQTCTVMVPQTQTRAVNYNVCRTVMHEETRQYTVQVPVQESRTVMRQVFQMVPVSMTRTVCEDQGHWETRGCDVAAPTSAPGMQTPPAPPVAGENGSPGNKNPEGRFPSIHSNRRLRRVWHGQLRKQLCSSLPAGVCSATGLGAEYGSAADCLYLHAAADE